MYDNTSAQIRLTNDQEVLADCMTYSIIVIMDGELLTFTLCFEKSKTKTPIKVTHIVEMKVNC